MRHRLQNCDTHNSESVHFLHISLISKSFEFFHLWHVIALARLISEKGVFECARIFQRFALSGMDMTRADYDGRTALHLAAAEGRLEVVRLLIEKLKVNIDTRDRYDLFHSSHPYTCRIKHTRLYICY